MNKTFKRNHPTKFLIGLVVIFLAYTAESDAKILLNEFFGRIFHSQSAAITVKEAEIDVAGECRIQPQLASQYVASTKN